MIINITLPTTLKSIGNTAFSNCTSLTDANIPSSVTTTGTQIFKSCNKLACVNINITSFSTKITSYSNSWFNGCSSSLILHIPSSVTSPTTAYGNYWNNYGSGSNKLTYYADL